MGLPHIKDNQNNWTVVCQGESFQFDPTNPEYIGLMECVKVGDSEEFYRLISVGTVIEDWSEGKLNLKDGFLFYEGEMVAQQPTERMIDLLKNNWDHQPMVKYLDLLYSNVSNRAVRESYDWCAHKGLPISEDGYLIGYKGVIKYSGPDCFDKMGRQIIEGDLVDKYTGKSYRNNPGDTNNMARRSVDDDHENGCSQGLHVGTFEYAKSWAGPGGVVVLVKFSPADIVSVPSDCEFQKLRCSNYEVLDIVCEILDDPIYTQEDDYDEYDDDLGY